MLHVDQRFEVAQFIGPLEHDLQVLHGVAVVGGQWQLELRQPLLHGTGIDLVAIRAGTAGHRDRTVRVGYFAAIHAHRGLALGQQVDLHDVRALLCGDGLGGQVRGSAAGGGAVADAHDIEQRDEPTVDPATDLDVLLGVFLTRDGREQHDFRCVLANRDARTVAIHQTGQQHLVRGGDELLVERGPEGRLFEIRIHSG